MKKEDIMVIRKNKTMIENVLRTWLFGVMNRTWQLDGGQVPIKCDDKEKVRIRNHVMRCYWNNYSLMFDELVVLRFEEWKQIILDLHNEIGHFDEGRNKMLFLA